LIQLYTDSLVGEYGDLDCDYVFINLWGGDIGVAMLRDRRGVTFIVYMLRHTCATDLLRRDVPAEVVQKLLGLRR